MESREKRDNRIGIFTSLGIHVAVFVLLFFIMAWRAPNPPLAEFGVELNFGLDDAGSGEVQPTENVGDDSEKEGEKVAESSEQKQEVKSDEKEVAEEVPKITEEVVSKTESDVKEREVKKENPDGVVKENPKEVKPKEVVKVEYKKDDKKAIDPNDASKKGEKGNQGDDKNKTGDKGSSEGTLDAKALYGTKGGGGGGDGMDLQMTGWAWADQPKIPELPDNENGKVIFEIECDDSGDIIGIKTLERSLSPKAEQILLNEIRKNSLVRTSGGRVPERSKGRIVFILKTK